jgi:LIVCS family branched-chain amino acid:cation transporter
MSAASWDAIMQFTGWQTDSRLPIIVFNCGYYALTYWFVSSRGKTMERIGKILFPILVTIVACIIIKGVITPISDTWIEPSYDKSPFIYGFLEGYATADLLCALLYGLVIISGLKNAGVSLNKQNSGIIKVGFIGMSVLCLAHLGHMIVGANTGGTIPLSYAQLYTEVVRSLLGNGGGIFFCIALTASAMTTASGLTSSTAEYMEDATSGKLSYKWAAIATCVLSIVISSIGLNAIVTIITPLLNMLYPGAIVMVIYYVFMPKFNEKNSLFALSIAFYSATICGFLDVIATYNTLLGINSSLYNTFYSALPLSSCKLTWVPVSIICFFAVLLICKIKTKKQICV